MGSQFSKTKGQSSRNPPPRQGSSGSSHSNHSSSDTEKAGDVNPEADLSSYEAACQADPQLRSLDASLQQRTSRAINSIAVGLDFRALSLDSLREVTECLLEMNQEVVNVILQCKKDIWKDPDLYDLVTDYFENSLQSLDFCTSLESCLKRALHTQSIILLALQKFEQEHENAGPPHQYPKTLEELSNFKATGDPFTREFFSLFQDVYKRQVLMLEKLQAKKRKLDRKLKSMKVWRKVCNVIFISAFVSVLICSVVAAAVTAPPVVTALAAAAAVPLGSMGKWLNSIWSKCEKDLKGQREVIFSMQIGNYVVIKDLDSIRVLVDKLQIEIEALLQTADFAMREDEAVVIAVADIKKKVNGFMKTIQDLNEHADKCSRDIRRARAVILRRIISYPSSSNQSNEHKQAEPVRQNSPKTKKSSKLFNKRDVEPKTYMRDIITKIANILRYSTWDSAKNQLQGLAIKWDSFTVNQVLKTHPPMEKAWLFFSWASGLKGFKHDRFTYTTMLDIFGEARRISSMMYVFQQMQEKGIKIDVVTYTSLLHWLSNDGDIDGAINLWREMRAKGCHPTVVSYTAYMKNLFDHNRVKEGTEVYKEMLQAGCEPNCHTYTVLMEHLANAGKFKEAMEIFSKMQEAGVPPDKATCNILVGKCCSAKNTETMQQILHYMREKALVLRVAVYREALETLIDAGENDTLLKQVNYHLSVQNFEKVKTNEFSELAGDSISAMDRALVLHLLSKQNLFAIDCLLADLRDKKSKLDPGVISLIIEVNCSHCRQVGALAALEYSVELDIEVERTAYLDLLGLLIRTNFLKKVVDVVHEMVRSGVSLDTHLGSLIIFRLGCARELVCAGKVFGLLPDEQRSTTTYTALIAAYFSSGDVDKGLETFETMKRRRINVALGTYHVLITGLERSGQGHELDTYRKEMKIMQSGSCPQDVSSEEMMCNLLFICW